MIVVFLLMALSVNTECAKETPKRCQIVHQNKYTDVPCVNLGGYRYAELPEAATVLQTSELPKDPRLMPEIGNGHIATVIQGDSMFMNGLYNGYNCTSHRARIASTCGVITECLTNCSSRIYKLDLARGIFIERYDGDGFYMEIRTYAHRVLNRLFVVEIEMSRQGNQNVTMGIKVNSGKPSTDIKYNTQLKHLNNGKILVGRTTEPEYPSIVGTIPVGIIYDDVPDNITIPNGISAMTVYFFTGISLQSSESITYYDKGMELMVNRTLLSTHVDAWMDVWNKGRIDVEGNDDLARTNYASLYYLLSSLPLQRDQHNWPFWGLAPCGLAHGDIGDYLGRKFWDQETWMFPSILLLHVDISKLIIDSRVRKLTLAQANAGFRGYKGALYPWETAFTGLEVDCPGSMGFSEFHLSSDISFAIRQFFYLTNDTDFILHEMAGETMLQIAEFWESYVYLNPTTNMYEFNNVTGPDEYNVGVNNSVYTNILAGMCLQSAQMAGKMMGKETPKVWQDIQDRLYIPYDKDTVYHPEFDGYKIGTSIKQADVILIGFPFMYKYESDEARRNDLNIYEKVVGNGPAMTWGMYAVNWLELGGNKNHADELFLRGTKNVQKPFYTWTENADGSGAVNFHTGMGGYLQSVIYGYGGFRINENSLNFNPQMLPGTSRWNITGLDYRGNSLDFSFQENEMFVTLTNRTSTVVKIYLYKDETTKILSSTSQTFPVQKAEITVE
ncbi:hypothetical protein SNE40_008830 [Patella caerulea]